MRVYKQTFAAINATDMTVMGTIKTTTSHDPLKNNDGHALKLARDVYGPGVARVDLRTTEESKR